MNPDVPEMRCGVLSSEEELVLSLVREIIDKIRADDSLAEIGRVEKALFEAGARIECDAAASKDRVLTMRNARFYVRNCADQPGTVELTFIEGGP